VFITGMLSLGVWQVMDTLIASREGVERVSGQFREVQRTMSLLERDLFRPLNGRSRTVSANPYRR